MLCCKNIEGFSAGISGDTTELRLALTEVGIATSNPKTQYGPLTTAHRVLLINSILSAQKEAKIICYNLLHCS